MQLVFAFTIASILFSSAFGGPTIAKTSPLITLDLATHQSKAFDGCKTCIDFATDSLKVLVEEIIQVGIMGSCEELCQALADKTGSEILGGVCRVLCSVGGVAEFAKLVQRADLDPIYYCELVSQCPINDHGDAKFVKVDVVPNKAPKGSEFDISFEYVSQNGTGTGQLAIDIDTVDQVPLNAAFLHELAPAGSYIGTIKLKAEKDPNCQSNCEKWKHGNYTVHLALCNGECGSKHPHSQIYDTAETTFEITKSDLE